MPEVHRGKWRLETSVQLAVGGIFLAAGLLAVLLVNQHERAQALRGARDKALVILHRNLATHAYFTRDLKPSVFALTEGVRPPSYFDPSWMSSTHAVRQIDGYFRELAAGEEVAGYYYKEAAIGARSPANEADPVEREFLQDAGRDPALVEWSGVRRIDGRPVFVVMRRGESMEGSCLLCHSRPERAPSGLVDRYGPVRSFGRAEGDLVSAVSIRIPLETAFAEANAFSRKFALGVVAVLGLIYAAQLLLHRRLFFRPLASLRNTAAAIAVDERRAGETAPLPRGLELRELTQAFNAMSSALGRDREELERKVTERTSSLEREMRERAEADARLRQAQKMEAVGRLAGGVAHDFNNLLTVINASAEMVLADLPESDPLRQEVQEIRAAGQRAATLTRQLLAFSRRDSGRARLVDLGDVVERMAGLLQRLLREDVHLRVERRPGPKPVLADASRLEQVVLNLAVNARDAMPSGGRIEIEIGEEEIASAADGTPPGRYVSLTVRDTGVGMDEETVARVFEPFFSTKRGEGGAGLGLATVHGIVHGLGGRIRVESAPGRGSTFRVLLPRAEEASGRSAIREDGPAAPEGRARGAVLIVEDEAPVRRVAQRILAGQGYEVHEAADAEEALRIFEARGGRFDAVVTDVVMPGLGGPALAERLRARVPGLPVLFVSGYTADALPPGLEEHLLQKPYLPEELVRRVGEVVRKPGS